MKQFLFLKITFIALFYSFAIPAFSQIEFKIHWMEEEEQWGVFARIEKGVDINVYNIIGSGQVTILAPTGSGFTGLTSVSGEWTQNAYIPAPEENPQIDYISFGLLNNYPEIQLLPEQETLLFTFKKRDGECPEFLSLINNDDPLAIFPNSVSANAGNDLSVMDPKSKETYSFSRNYMPDAWNCNKGEIVELGDYIRGKKRYIPKVLKP